MFFEVFLGEASIRALYMQTAELLQANTTLTKKAEGVNLEISCRFRYIFNNGPIYFCTYFRL